MEDVATPETRNRMRSLPDVGSFGPLRLPANGRMRLLPVMAVMGRWSGGGRMTERIVCVHEELFVRGWDS